MTAAIINSFLKWFDESILKKVLIWIGCVFRKSGTRKALKMYADKKPWFLNSFTYRVIRKAVGWIDFAADKIHEFCKSIIEKSVAYESISSIKNEKIGDKLVLTGIFFMAASIGFLFISLFLDGDRNANLAVAWGLFFVGLLFAFSGRNLENVKKSLTFRFFKFLFELVKM